MTTERSGDGGKNPFPFFPLIVLLPMLSVYSANLAYVPASQLVRPGLVTLGATILLIAILSVALRSVVRGAAAATVAVLSVFAFSWLRGFIPRFYVSPIAVWGVSTAILAALAAWKLTAVRALNVVCGAILLVSVANLGLSILRASKLSPKAAPVADLKAAKGARPDVFYIILDGYGRTDAIQRTIGYDDSPFTDGLRKRGFFVAQGSHANYCQTELSLSSSLNMDFIPNLLPDVGASTIERKPLADLVGENEVVRRFRARGYRFISVTSGFPPIQFPTADLQLSDHSGATMVESALLSMTPLSVGDSLGESQFIARRKQLKGAFDNLKELASPTASPRLVIAHILAPHPPFVFGPNGEVLPHKGVYGFWDGDDYTTYVDTKEAYKRGYAGQVEWLDKQVLKMVDALLARWGVKPIVIIQGDHGPKSDLAQNSLEKTDVAQVFPILNAYLVPEEIRKDLTPDITPVNSFRTILRNLFDDDLPDLPNRSWYSRFATPYAFTEVTDRIEHPSPFRGRGAGGEGEHIP